MEWRDNNLKIVRFCRDGTASKISQRVISSCSVNVLSLCLNKSMITSSYKQMIQLASRAN